MWLEQDNALHLTLSLPTFGQALALLNHIAQLAEKANHHPTITINYTQLTLRLTTHDAGHQITQQDRDLADAIVAIVPANATVNTPT
jgi:4a-hydroxytetrahydrobiopterin dehydratase